MKTRKWRCWSADAWRRGARVGTGGSPSAAAQSQARCQADLLEAGERRHTQRWLCAAICQAWRLPHSVANQPWQHDGWAVAHAKELLLLLLLAQLRAGQTYSFVFCLLPFPLSFFPSFHSVCHSINSNSSLFFFVFLSLLLILSLTECCCGSACSTICDKKSSETTQTESWRDPIQGWCLSHSLPPNTACCFLSLHHLLLLPLSDNTPTQMCMHL